MINKTISHYRIIEKLGWGGMGVVYKALDLKLDRSVAIKFLPPSFNLDEEAKKQFINEAKSASSLQHQNICTIHEIDETDKGQLFICMDFYEGETLKKKISSGLLNISEKVEILINILEGLAAAHEKEIIHRDIKPANIFITNKNKVKILDFGLAKNSAYSNITKKDSTAGTIAYISPEQAQGKEATQQSDLWSLGVVMYEMLTNQLPFKGEYDQVIIYSIVDKEPKKISSINLEIPLELEHIASRALEKNIDNRYKNVEEVLFDLKSFQSKINISVKTKSIANKKRRIKTNFVLAVLVFFAVIIFYFSFLKKEVEFLPVTIAVVGFENQTGDTTYNYLQKAIPNLLITNLEQSKHLQVTTWERMQDLLKQTHKEKIEIIDKELGFELSDLAGIDAIVIGSFIKAGDVFVTDVKVLDAKTKKLLKTANIKSNGLASILNNQIDYLSDEIVSGIGLTAGDIESVQLRIADVSTTSMEAYKYFQKGKEEFDRFYFKEAIKYFEMSIQTDSTFAVAHLHKGLVQFLIFERSKMIESFSKANKFKSHATDKEKIYIEAFSYWADLKNFNKALLILEQGLKKYPREKTMHLWLGRHYNFIKEHAKALKEYNKVLSLDPEYGLIYSFIGNAYADAGKYEKAVENINKYISLYPQNADSYTHLGYVFFRMGKIDQAIEQLKKAIELKGDFGRSAILPMLFLLKEDYSESLKWQDIILNSRSTESLKIGSIWWKSFNLYWVGNIKKSLSFLEEIVESNEQVEDIWIARVGWLRGWIYYDKGMFGESQKNFKIYSNYITNRSGAKMYHTAKSYLFLGLTNFGKGRMDSVRNILNNLAIANKNELDKGRSHIIIYHQKLLYGSN